ncbi:hypothetical protein GCM10027569_62790 [Flindersiella endophytica]
MEDVSSQLEPIRPFRWKLVQRDQLGTLLSGCQAPSLWYLQSLVSCAAKVLARCAGAGKDVLAGPAAPPATVDDRRR